MEQLTSTSDVIQALGGAHAVARLTGRSYKSVMRWKTARDKFPAVTYLTIQRALTDAGRSAMPSLWHKMDVAA